MNLSNGRGEQNVRGQLLGNSAAFILLYFSLPSYGLSAVIIAYLAQVIFARTYSIVAAKILFNHLPNELFTVGLIAIAGLTIFSESILQVNLSFL